MSINSNPFNCDVCTHAKQETNHWLLGRPVYNPTVDSQIIIGYLVIKWDEELCEVLYTAHLCGLECAAKWLMKKLSALQSIPAPSLGADTKEII